MSEQKILIYDLETTLLWSLIFALGKQVLRHNQLLKGYFSRTHVICITYQWSHEKTPHILTWGDSIEDEKKMIIEFDKLIKQADIVIGKNSNRFDNKHINTQRLWHDLPGCPDWIRYTDDLESQMRKYLYLPSYSLDYISEQLGLGGKKKMEFSDWVDIGYYRLSTLLPSHRSVDVVFDILTGQSRQDIVKKGKKAEKKMFVYGKKDTKDTAALWNYCSKHFETKGNHSKPLDSTGGILTCKQLGCQSTDLCKNGHKVVSGVKYQKFHCNTHNGYAGRSRKLKSGKWSKMV